MKNVSNFQENVLMNLTENTVPPPINSLSATMLCTVPMGAFCHKNAVQFKHLTTMDRIKYHVVCNESLIPYDVSIC